MLRCRQPSRQSQRETSCRQTGAVVVLCCWGWAACGRGPAAGRPLFAPRRDATGSDWQPATSAGRTIARVFSASGDQGPAGGLDLAGRAQPIRRGAGRPAPRRIADRLGLSPARDEHPHGRGLEVFPTIEVIDRLYTPPEQQVRFAIPVQLTARGVAAGVGRQVRHAGDLPGRSAAGVAGCRRSAGAELVRGGCGRRTRWWWPASLGRPVAILRLGGRVPGGGPDPAFFYGSPPFVQYTPQAEMPRPHAAGRANRPPSRPPNSSRSCRRHEYRRDASSATSEGCHCWLAQQCDGGTGFARGANTACVKPSHSLPPDHWQPVPSASVAHGLIALATLILCSCRRPAGPGADGLAAGRHGR